VLRYQLVLCQTAFVLMLFDYSFLSYYSLWGWSLMLYRNDGCWAIKSCAVSNLWLSSVNSSGDYVGGGIGWKRRQTIGKSLKMAKSIDFCLKANQTWNRGALILENFEQSLEAWKLFDDRKVWSELLNLFYEKKMRRRSKICMILKQF
jgi:hypothetical protein